MKKNDFEKIKSDLSKRIDSHAADSITAIARKYKFSKIFPLKNYLIHYAALWHANDTACGHERLKAIKKSKNPDKKIVEKAIRKYQNLLDVINQLSDESLANPALSNEEKTLKQGKDKFIRFLATFPSKQGPKTSCTTTDITRFLLAIYEKGTNKSASLKSTFKKNQNYTKHSYNFLIEVSPIMKILRINIGKYNTIKLNIRNIVDDGSLTTLKFILAKNNFAVPYQTPAKWAN